MADLNFAGSYDGLHLPYSPEAEQAVLGAIILESDTFDKVVDTLKSPDYFYVSLHKLIFAQMQEMIGLGLSIDFVTLLEKLKQNKAFDETTGKPILWILSTIVRQFQMPRSMRRLLRKSTMFADLLRRPVKLLMTQLQATRILRF